MESPITGADDLIRMLAGEKIGRSIELECCATAPASALAGAAGARASPASAADLKFLGNVCRESPPQEFQIEKRHENHRVASALWFSKFVPEWAAPQSTSSKTGH